MNKRWRKTCVYQTNTTDDGLKISTRENCTMKMRKINKQKRKKKHRRINFTSIQQIARFADWNQFRQEI